MAYSIKTVGVVGTGVIGASWTTLFLAKELKVIVSDPAAGAKQKPHDFIDKKWPLMERIGLSFGASKTSMRFVDDVANHLDEIDFIQENAPELKDFKIKLIRNLDAGARPKVIIASSSSEPREGLDRPSPPHLITFVELVPHPGTSDQVTKRAMEFYTSLGKQPILIRKEVPGFVANRLQAVLNTEAMALVQRGIVTAEAVDLAVTSSLGMRWSVTGPLMCNVLGGGGGRDGFLNIQKKIRCAAIGWLDGMDKHRFENTDQNLEKVNASVQDWIGPMDLAAVESERDKIVLAIMEKKRESSQK